MRARSVPEIRLIGWGFIYTVWSEWFNTRMAGTWSYAPSMPMVFGVSVSPFLQWLLVRGTFTGGWSITHRMFSFYYLRFII